MFRIFRQDGRAKSAATIGSSDISIFHWKQGENSGNFGDALSLLYEKHYFSGPCLFQSGNLHLVGSVITETRLKAATARGIRGARVMRPIFWGCGKKNEDALDLKNLQKAIFLGVRGPLTRDSLGLPFYTPLGDTALLLPQFYDPKKDASTEGKVLWVPHVHHPELTDEDFYGCDDYVVKSPAIPNSVEACEQFIDAITSARFVMANAMHAAVVALAYGVPFAFWGGRYINVPFKWADLSKGVGFEMPFAKDYESAVKIYDSVRPDRSFKDWDPNPLMAVAPFEMRR